MSDAPAPARNFNHIAFPTADTEATRRFYTEVLDMKLVGAVRPDMSGTTRQEHPHIHTFFATGSGECIAFFEIPGFRPQPNKDGAPDFTRHIAFGVDSEEQLLAWRRRLQEKGVEVSGVIEHEGIWKSIYFRDPNHLVLELTWQTRPLSAEDADNARAMVEDWNRTHGGWAAGNVG
ncbi:MAG TPA: VOC family protein [Candidatus Limnocylindrales bacterium]|nr:VOC family protein [Candidatus Limnocylindrales bacterium]